MEKDQPTQGLHKNVAKAAAIRGMCQTEGYKLLMVEVDKEKKRVSDKVLDASVSDEDVLKFRKEAQVWGSLDKILKKIMLVGEFSARSLANLDEFKTSSIQGE